MPIVSSGSPIEQGNLSPEEEKSRRELLIKVYEAAVAEYRFNVQLNWDRTKFYLGLGLTAIAAGVGLIKLSPDSVTTSVFLTCYFFLLMALTFFGSQAVAKGKQYSRQAVLTKTLVERELDLFKETGCFGDPGLHLGIAVTPGARNYTKVIFERKERENKKPDIGSVLQQTQWIFWILIFIEFLGAILTWVNFINQVDTKASSSVAVNRSRPAIEGGR